MTVERMLQIFQKGDTALKVFASGDSIYRVNEPSEEPDDCLEPCTALIEMPVQKNRIENYNTEAEFVKVTAVVTGNLIDSSNILTTEDFIEYLKGIKDKQEIICIVNYFNLLEGKICEVYSVLTKKME